MQPLKWIQHIRQTQPPYKGWNRHWPSSVTQFVISAIGETDLELMITTEYVYHQLHLKRAYFSSFNPIIDTPLENIPPGSPIREHRLYEASFLIRDYGFSMEELPFDQGGHLPLDIDPKYAWAKQHLIGHPVDINRAEKQMLLRIPGIGPKIANSILDTRTKNKISSFGELSALGVNLNRASQFILINGKYSPYQISYF
jgi:predicted DNA-binding helix-hairpin-helix protein